MCTYMHIYVCVHRHTYKDLLFIYEYEMLIYAKLWLDLDFKLNCYGLGPVIKLFHAQNITVAITQMFSCHEVGDVGMRTEAYKV